MTMTDTPSESADSARVDADTTNDPAAGAAEAQATRAEPADHADASVSPPTAPPTSPIMPAKPGSGSSTPDEPGWSLAGPMLAMVLVGGVLGGLVVGGVVWTYFGMVVGALQQQIAGAEEAAGEQGGPPPAAVFVADATIGRLQDRFPVVGRLAEVRRALVASQVEGRVVAVNVEEGDRVVGGQTVLAEVDPVVPQLNYRSAVAEVQRAQANLDQAQSDLRQLESLRETDVAKPKEVEDARARVKALQAALDNAVAQRELRREEVERLKVLAPFDGVVVSKITEVGEWLEPSDAVAEIVSSGQIDADINVPERIVNRFEVGDEVLLKVDALERDVVGKVASITPDAANAARTFPVQVRVSDALDGRDGVLKPGMSVTAYVPLGASSDQLTVPRDAVQFTASGTQVWVVMPGGPPDSQAPPIAMPVPVEVAFGVGDRYAVRPIPNPGEPVDATGLVEGATVVTQGMERLFPGRPVNAMHKTQATAAAAMRDAEPGGG